MQSSSLFLMLLLFFNIMNWAGKLMLCFLNLMKVTNGSSHVIEYPYG